MKLLGKRLREIGLTAQLLREMPTRHAALRDDPVALAVRLFRDHAQLTSAETLALFEECDPPPSGLSLDIVEGLYLFSAPDRILGPGETTAILYRAARKAPGRSLLDLGCGCGSLSLLLARERTLATDIDQRALDLTQWNAAINGIHGIETRAGSLYQPVAGERFDLIISQPPYVPCHPGEKLNPYYHAGQRGDELAHQIIEGAPRHLSDAGRALIFSDWTLTAGETLRDRITCSMGRVTVFVSSGIDPSSYFAPLPADTVAVHNCLTIIQHGIGYAEHRVLPHEWGSLGIQ